VADRNSTRKAPGPLAIAEHALWRPLASRVLRGEGALLLLALAVVASLPRPAAAVLVPRALRDSPAAFAAAALFLGLLIAVVYGMNDLCDRPLDLATPGKRRASAAFLIEHRRAAATTLAAACAVLLALAALQGAVVAAATFVVVGVGAVYSRWLKRQPFAD